MPREASSPMHRLTVAGEVFLCAWPPEPVGDRSVDACLAAAIASDPSPPSGLIYWDGRVEDGKAAAWARFGRGGLDPILAGEVDLSECVAIEERVLSRLMDRGAGRTEATLGRAVALLARSPGVKATWCDGLAGRIDPSTTGPISHSGSPPSHADALSIVVLVNNAAGPVEPFFAALKGQAIAGSLLDVVVMALGLDSQQLKVLARALAVCGAADPRLKIRRYSFSGALSAGYLANIGVGLCSSEAVVLADVRCIPLLADTIQRLADWSVSGDAVAACPRVVFKGRLVSAGLGLKRTDEGKDVLGLWNDPVLSDQLRTAAAPSPWFFGLRRSAWVAAQGLRDLAQAELWTGEFAFDRAPRGRTLLVGSEIVEWIGAAPPVAPAVFVPASWVLQPPATVALRDPVASDAVVVAPPAVRPSSPAPPAVREASESQVAFTDPFPSPAEARILVFADAFAASQSIAFVQGLAGARARGSAAVRIIEEAAFEGDSRALDQPAATELVEAQMEQTQPSVVVASRLGHSAVWRALYAAARRRGVPILFHIDDDIFDLPAVLGIERYRLGRNPKRQQALQEGLSKADLILATTPVLAERLVAEFGAERVVALEFGTAGNSPQPRGARSDRGGLAIGYMGSASHDHDLAMVAPALNSISADYDQVRIILFGSIAEQPSAKLLHGRVERHGPVQRDYPAFLRRLAELGFDIGLAPLRDNSFNRAKTATKWVEYAEAGVPTLVSRVAPYMPIAEAGATLAVRPDQWEPALRRLIADPQLRADLVRRADELLLDRFAWDRLEREILAAVQRACAPRRDAA